MPQVIKAVFEDGVIKPLEEVKLDEHQQIRVAISPLPGVVAETRALIRAPADVVREVAESDEFSPF
jgi:predicted DNA-binding antitoxin AbrB/MazE fold protein